MTEVCRRHGVLVIADEVMTGFGRTGRWFGVDHWDVRPDILTAGKGSTSGYVPFGFAAATGEVFETIAAHGFVHGFTWSHNAPGRPRSAAPCSGACARTASWSGAATWASACARTWRRRSTAARPSATSGASGC